MIHHGINLIDAIAAAKRLGVTVEAKRRTGEVRFQYGDRSQLQNARRKDATRRVVAFLKRVEKGR